MPSFARPISGGVDPPSGDPPATPEGTPTATTPTFVPSDEFKRTVETLQGTINAQAAALTQMQDTMNLVAARLAQPATESRPASSDAEITIEQYLEALDNHDAKTIQRYTEQREARLVATHVKPLETTGVTSLSTLTKELAIGARDDKGELVLPYYKTYQKEIDALIELTAPGQRLTPEVYRIAHDAIVGRHVKEIRDQAAEAAIRTASAPKPESQPGGRSSRETGGGTESPPTAESLGGREALDAMAIAGKDSDGLARRLGYKDWSDYMKTCKEYV